MILQEIDDINLLVLIDIGVLKEHKKLVLFDIII